MTANNSSKQILLVDDDFDVVEQLQMILQADGYTVITADSQASGEEALLSAKPDLAIFDLMMENSDSGFVLAHYLKNLYPQTPVILLTAVAAVTGMSFNSQNSEARNWTQVDKILDKPVRPEQLRAEVSRWLQA